MKSAFDEHRESVERFVRSENVARFRRMFETEPNEFERRILSDLIDQETERKGTRSTLVWGGLGFDFLGNRGMNCSEWFLGTHLRLERENDGAQVLS